MAINEEILSTLSDMVFVGNVSSTLPDEGKAIVTRLDRDGVVTAPLSVLNRGTASAKDYWMPAIALCCQTGQVEDSLTALLSAHSSAKLTLYRAAQVTVSGCSMFRGI